MKKSKEYNLTMARYLVKKLGFDQVARGLLCSNAALADFLKTGETRNKYINQELAGYFFGVFRDELDEKSGVKNYDDENLSDLNAGPRKGGAGGGSNNSFRATVGDTYL